MPQSIVLPGLKPYEQPVVSGSPARIIQPTPTRILYMIIGVATGLLSGLQLGFAGVGIPYFGAEMNLTPVEQQWYTLSFLMSLIWMSSFLLKYRENVGIMPFVRATLILAFISSFILLSSNAFWVQIVGRFLSGIVSAGLVATAVYYCMQGVPNALTMVGLVIGSSCLQLANPMGRWLGAILLEHDGIASTLYVFQLGWLVIVTAGILYLPIPPTFKKATFQWVDFAGFGMWAIGTACLVAFVGMGLIVWWDTPWLGYLLVVGLLAPVLGLVLESQRKLPILFPRWMLLGPVLRFALLSFMFRFVLGEQLFGATKLLSYLGYGSDELVVIYGLVTLGAAAGLLAMMAILKPPDLRIMSFIAFTLVAIASFMDVGVGAYTRPQELYLTQTIMGFCLLVAYGALFLEGLSRALACGTAFVVTHVAVFAASQSLGSLSGVAFYGTFLKYRVKAHLIDMGAETQLGDPNVMAAIGRLASGQLNTMTPSPAELKQGVPVIINRFVDQAVFQSFNEMFFLCGCIASMVVLTYGLTWVYYKLQGKTGLESVFEKSMQEVEAKDGE